jgi:hypothetical protein
VEGSASQKTSRCGAFSCQDRIAKDKAWQCRIVRVFPRPPPSEHGDKVWRYQNMYQHDSQSIVANGWSEIRALFNRHDGFFVCCSHLTCIREFNVQRPHVCYCKRHHDLTSLHQWAFHSQLIFLQRNSCHCCTLSIPLTNFCEILSYLHFLAELRRCTVGYRYWYLL